MDWLLYEKEAISKGYANVCGVDEAGRGPLAFLFGVLFWGGGAYWGSNFTRQR